MNPQDASISLRFFDAEGTQLQKYLLCSPLMTKYQTWRVMVLDWGTISSVLNFFKLRYN